MKSKKLTDAQIEETCRDLLALNRTVSFLMLKAELQGRYGACGRAVRVNQILGRVRVALEYLGSRGTSRHAAPPMVEDDLASLEERVRVAERRAAEAEERERRNQDFFANRYAEQRAQLEAERARQPPRGIPVEVYLKTYRRAVYYRNRLSVYEIVEELPEVDDSGEFSGPRGGG